MKLLVALCLLALLAIVSCSPALERVRRQARIKVGGQTSIDVDVRRQEGQAVGTVGITRQIPGGNIRGQGTFSDGKPLWRAEVNRQLGKNKLNFNIETQGGHTSAGAEFTHRTGRWGDFGVRVETGRESSVGFLWKKQFRRAAAKH